MVAVVDEHGLKVDVNLQQMLQEEWEWWLWLTDAIM
jgi:hypothetical protein